MLSNAARLGGPPPSSLGIEPFLEPEPGPGLGDECGAPGAPGAVGVGEEGKPSKKERLSGTEMALSMRLGVMQLIGVRECMRVGTEAMVLGA